MTHHRRSWLLLVLLLSVASGCDRTKGHPAGYDESAPAWAADAIWYQIFPERFANGDISNDPTWETLELGSDIPETWHLSSWTKDWYERDQWEIETGPDFYHDGVFQRRFGGDLQGVMDRLDYLDSLGINAIYFNPLFWARSLHKYDGNTFHHIDPHFGPDPEGDYEIIRSEDPLDPATWQWTAADRLFLDLIREARARDIRIIIDGVFNHTGRDFFAFADLRENQQDSPFADWYVVHSFEDPDDPESTFQYDGWWGFEHLPEFALNDTGDDLHPGSKAYIFEATRRWMDPSGDGDPSDGVDGWRLDVTEEVPIGFWQDWNAHVRSINPQAYTVTEIWDEASEFVTNGGFSATMNYYAFAEPLKDFLLDGSITASDFAERLHQRKEKYPDAVTFAVQNLVDSHDTDRFASMIVNRGQNGYNDQNSPRDSEEYDIRKPTERERDIQRLAALFQMTYLGAPLIYFGTEAGMWGAKDPDCRMPMVWPEMQFAPQQTDPRGFDREIDEVTFDHDLFDFYRDVISLRTEQPALRRGSLKVLLTDDAARTVAFERRHLDDLAVVLLNRSDRLQDVNLSRDDLKLTPGDEVAVLFSTTQAGEAVEVLVSGDVISVLIPGLTGAVLKAN